MEDVMEAKKVAKSKTGVSAMAVIVAGATALQQGEPVVGVVLIAVGAVAICLRDTLAKIEARIADGN